jgi:superfamily II DNA/RNA helicase
VATDAAGEGINLQRAHLMVNYDLPWNPNRLEQRFGRIHRIGQTEVCHMWNLVAEETREGDVFKRLLDKLEEQRKALGGGVFRHPGQALPRENGCAICSSRLSGTATTPTSRPGSSETVDNLADRERCRELLEERALVHDTLDASQVRKIREDMQRAEARRLQPHFVQSFFVEAFKHLGGRIHPREPRRFEIHPRAGGDPRPGPRHRHARAFAPALRAHHLPQRGSLAGGQTGGGIRLSWPSASRCDARPAPGAGIETC